MITLFPIDKMPISDEDLLLPTDIMQKFYNVRRLFSLLLDVKTQDKKEFFKRFLLFTSEEKRLNRIVQFPLFSALRKEVFLNKDRIDFWRAYSI
jgi:hypothetical protein